MSTQWHFSTQKAPPKCSQFILEVEMTLSFGTTSVSRSDLLVPSFLSSTSLFRGVQFQSITKLLPSSAGFNPKSYSQGSCYSCEFDPENLLMRSWASCHPYHLWKRRAAFVLFKLCPSADPRVSPQPRCRLALSHQQFCLKRQLCSWHREERGIKQQDVRNGMQGVQLFQGLLFFPLFSSHFFPYSHLQREALRKWTKGSRWQWEKQVLTIIKFASTKFL